MKARNIVFAVIISLIGLVYSHVFIYIYSYARMDAETPFSLPADSYYLTNKNNVEIETEELLNLLPKSNVILFSIDTDLRRGAIYDPDLMYSNVPLVVTGYTRYYSPEDFSNNISAGVKMLHMDYDYDELFMCIFDKNSSINNEFEELLYCVTNNEVIYNENIDYIINLNATKYLGDQIYVYSEDKDTMKEISNHLRSLGYDSEILYDWRNNIEDVTQELSNIRIIPLIVSLSILIILYTLVIFIFHLNNKDESQIHRIVGGRAMSIYYHTHFKFIIYSIILLPVIYFVFIYLSSFYGATIYYLASFLFLAIIEIIMIFIHLFAYIIVRPYKIGEVK